MAVARVNPTRMELTRQKRRLATAARGHKLLKDKRDEMIRRFVDMARTNKELRERVEKRLESALFDFMLARAVMSSDNMEQAMMYPAREVELEIGSRNIMSVDVPAIHIKEIKQPKSGASYGYAFTSAELDGAISTMADVLADLIKLAESEKSCNMLADEIEKTRRRVNALEHVIIPETQDTIKYISMKLDENERGSLTRLMKVKDMIAEREDKNRTADSAAYQ